MRRHDLILTRRLRSAIREPFCLVSTKIEKITSNFLIPQPSCPNNFGSSFLSDSPLNEPNLKKTHLTNKKILPGEHNFHKNEKVSLRYVVNNDLKAENLNHK